MSITINIYYTGHDGSARKFAEEMVSSGIVKDVRNEEGKDVRNEEGNDVRNEEGNERYDYFFPLDDPQTVLLIDRWRDQQALD